MLLYSIGFFSIVSHSLSHVHLFLKSSFHAQTYTLQRVRFHGVFGGEDADGEVVNSLIDLGNLLADSIHNLSQRHVLVLQGLELILRAVSQSARACMCGGNIRSVWEIDL